MGFIDWIYERNAEKCGQWLDSVYPVEPAEPVQHPCPYCSAILNTKEELIRHTRTGHPLELPLLLVRGVPATTELVLRAPLKQADVDLENCSAIECSSGAGNYSQINFDELKTMLTSRTDGLLSLRLSNERSVDDVKARREHRIRFRIANPNSLAAIETRFIDCMQRLPISVPSAEEFWQECDGLKDNTASADYANALSVYIIGLAIKQGGTGAEHLSFDRYKDKFMDSLGVLQLVPTLLAKGVAGVIRFNINDFGDWRGESPAFPGLQAAGNFFHAPHEALAGPYLLRRDALAQAARCPVDDLTERIIDSTLMILEGRFDDPALLSLLPPLLKWSPLPEYDRQKLNVLMATMYSKQGNNEKASTHFRALRSDMNFGAWAEGYLRL